MDFIYEEIDPTQYLISEWKEFLGMVEEPILSNASEALGETIDICVFIDSDNTHIINLCFLIYISWTPEYCNYKLVV